MYTLEFQKRGLSCMKEDRFEI